MEESFLEGLRTLERQSFVRYVTVVDKNGYSIAASGEATKPIASYVREVANCAESLFSDNSDIKIVIEGAHKSVSIGKQEKVLVGVQINKDLF